jgi:hypothetical protein
VGVIVREEKCVLLREFKRRSLLITGAGVWRR